jgi:BON domain
MGLFDFAKDMGKKLFEKNDDPAAKIKESIETANPGITNLGVAFNDGVVSLSGKVKSAVAVEKVVLMAGNVQGVTDVKIDKLDAPPPRRMSVLHHCKWRQPVEDCQKVL